MATNKKECHRDAEIAVLQNNHDTMAIVLKEIKDKQDKLFEKFDELKEFFVNGMQSHEERADIKYATKTEHQKNVERIDEIEKSNKSVLITLVGVLGTIVMGLIGIIWGNLDKIL